MNVAPPVPPRAGLGIAAAAWLALGAGAAAAESCRLALSLALDVSSSVDAAEYALQAEGLARALTAPEVRAAFLAEPDRPVALHVYEWSSRQQQAVKQDWVLVTGGAVLEAVAARLRARGRAFTEFPTALGYAMGFGAVALQQGPDCAARTLDVSGDGTNNEGFSPEIARREFPFDGVTVNGLVIGGDTEALRRYYEQFVIHGPGAFVEVAQDYGGFERAMRRKLVREVGPAALSGLAPVPSRR